MAEDIAQWLDSLELGQYADTFAENEIDFQLLPELTDDVLEKMGIAVIGHRLKLLRAIAALSEAGTEAKSPYISSSPEP